MILKHFWSAKTTPYNIHFGKLQKLNCSIEKTQLKRSGIILQNNEQSLKHVLLNIVIALFQICLCLLTVLGAKCAAPVIQIQLNALLIPAIKEFIALCIVPLSRQEDRYITYSP